jgi:hypothetical protein
MLSFKPTYTIPSPSKAADGISYTINRPTTIERANFELEHAEAFDQLAQIRREFARLPKPVVKTEVDAEGKSNEYDSYENDTPEQSDARAKLNVQFERLRRAKLYPVVIGKYLIQVKGFESVEEFVRTATDPLIHEAFLSCEATSQLSPEALKNLESPGTSSEAVAGQSETSSAATVAKAA